MTTALHVLGCSGSEAPGQGTVAFRLEDSILYEAGSAASRLSPREQAQISDVVLSHAHLDHVKDLAFLADGRAITGGPPITVHATAETLGVLRKSLFNGDLWPDFTALPTPENPGLVYSPLEAGATRVLGPVGVTPFSAAHSPGAVGHVFRSDSGVLLCSGDTGVGGGLAEVWRTEGDAVRAVLVEVSFPDRLGDLAKVSSHLTPETLAALLESVSDQETPVYAYHLKAPTREETLSDLNSRLGSRVSILAPDMVISF